MARRWLARDVAGAVVRAVVCAALLSGCGGSDEGGTAPLTGPSGEAPVGPLVAGTTYLSTNSWIELVPGDAPLVIVAPHGGSVAPDALPDRVCAGCVTGIDLSTQELARAVVDAFVQRTGRRPHLVINRLHRRKFDANRDLAEATGSYAGLTPTWRWLQAAIDSSTRRVSREQGRGLLIDLHGHGHDIARLELGYLLSASDLRRSDASLTAASDLNRTSISRLSTDARGGDRGVALLRGPNSLGALMVAAGFPAVPSPTTPAPLVGEEYFDGGFNTARNGSAAGGQVDAIQIETHYTGVRNTAVARSQFAAALVTALLRYLDLHYGWRP